MALLRRHDPEAQRIPRKDRRGWSPVLVAGLVLLLACVGVYFGFAKKVPFTHGFRMNAVFENANSIRPNSPVRIAGVNVGKVTKIERYKDTDASVVTFELNQTALPVHKDATAKIRPRIFLEGNFFVDLAPGTPSSPTLGDGDTIPMTQTAAPVQLGDVLTSLQQDTRKSLKQVLREYGNALTDPPTAADDANADPASRGKSAAQSLNDNFVNAGPALRDTSIVNEALLGARPDDLSTIVKSVGTISGALDRNEAQLKDLITNFDKTTSIFADESSNLQTSIRRLSPTLAITNRTLDDLNAAFPPTRAFAREILPGVKQTPATVQASFPWIKQTRALLAPSELQGLTRELSPATQDLAKAIDATNQLLPQTDLVSKCVSRVILPTGDIVIQDGDLTTGKANYKEFWYAMVGLASEGQNTDGNGIYVRFQPGAGSQTLSTGKGSISGESLFGRSDLAPSGTRPAYPGKRPPYRPDVPCYTQKIPDLNGAATGKPDASTTSTPPTLGNATTFPQQVTGVLQDVLTSLVTNVTGAAAQATTTGATGGVVGAVTNAVGAITTGAGATTRSSAKLAKGAASTTAGQQAATKKGTKAARKKAAADQGVAALLLSRLNPFRTGADD
jgi:phospholipid/cholesterol/gamma-HCH transport system substrate-binding protein